MEMIDSALALAAKGIRVFPCKPWQRAGRRRWLQAWHDRPEHDPRLVGFSSQLSTLVSLVKQYQNFVLDVDGIDAEGELETLERQHSELPRTIEVITARGRHVYFAWPDAMRIRNSASKLAHKGLDIRAEGGYTIAPPSIHPSGKRYEWSTDTAELILRQRRHGLLDLILAPKKNGSASGYTARTLVRSYSRWRR